VGAKTGLLAFTDGDLPVTLRESVLPDRAETAALVGQVLPGYTLEDVDDLALGYAVYPDDEIIYAATAGGTTILCDRRLMKYDRPSTLPRHLIDLAAGRRIVHHAMHSGSDWLAFAIWEQGRLVRSLSLSPDAGVTESIGTPLPFEAPYWAGEHPVRPSPFWPDRDPYPLPFHPLELGEDALRALFGFILEGGREPTDIDPDALPMHGFRAVDPSGREQAARNALIAAAGQMRLARQFRDGQWIEIENPGPGSGGPAEVVERAVPGAE
jgi:hypothetical protein